MFEKKNKNTFDILYFLGKNLNLKRKYFGIAGLKDKFGITRQRISIYKRIVNSRGGVNNFVNTLAKQSRILQIKWGNQLLKMGDNKGNLFFIRLRRKSLRKQGIKLKNEKFIQIVEKALNKIKENGFPNLF